MATGTSTVMTERQFRIAFSKLQGKHKRWVRDALGSPPDFRNVPKELWQKIQEEEAAIYLLLMTGVGQASVQITGRTSSGRQAELSVKPTFKTRAPAGSDRTSEVGSSANNGTVQRRVSPNHRECGR